MTGNLGTADYFFCVSGNQMTLRSDVYKTELVFDKVAIGGTPAACSARSLDSCELAGDCHKGACVGTTGCSAARTQSSCTTIQGCNWDTSQCGGTSPGDCTLEDYGLVAGCSFYPANSTCTGTATPCASITNGAACIGSCSQSLFSPYACQGTANSCSSLSTARCLGQTGCTINSQM